MATRKSPAKNDEELAYRSIAAWRDHFLSSDVNLEKVRELRKEPELLAACLADDAVNALLRNQA